MKCLTLHCSMKIMSLFRSYEATTPTTVSSKTESQRSRVTMDQEETGLGLGPCKHGVQNTGSATLSVQSLPSNNGHLPGGRVRGWALDKEKDGHSQTEEFRVFCVNCDTRVKVSKHTIRNIINNLKKLTK